MWSALKMLWGDLLDVAENPRAIIEDLRRENRELRSLVTKLEFDNANLTDEISGINEVLKPLKEQLDKIA